MTNKLKPNLIVGWLLWSVLAMVSVWGLTDIVIHLQDRRSIPQIALIIVMLFCAATVKIGFDMIKASSRQLSRSDGNHG